LPTYQYLCAGCQHSFELYQSFSADPIKVCPECQEEKVSKVISGGAGVVFKGGGFYETDYKRGDGSDYKKKSDSESGKGKKSPDAKSTSSDKPASTPKASKKD
jgi:putative FmdB family regulatory protein